MQIAHLLALRMCAAQRQVLTLQRENLPSGFLKGAWPKKGCTEQTSESLH